MQDDIDDPAWQSRMQSPSAHECRLAEALETILVEGIDDLEAIVSALNEHGLPGPGGLPWTCEIFRSEIKRRGEGNGLLWHPPTVKRTAEKGR